MRPSEFGPEAFEQTWEEPIEDGTWRMMEDLVTWRTSTRPYSS